jgi:acetyltransferase-like isoleucine patch superfamily enzyme
MSTKGDSPFIHHLALVDDGAIIGADTRVWAFAHVCNGAVIGEGCNICDHTFLEKGVRLGNRVTVKCGVYIWDNATAEDDVFIGPSVAFTNDLRPRSKRYKKFAEILLLQGCSIGANATLLPVTIGRWAMIGAGSVVTKDVPDFALMKGNPARQAGWVCKCSEKLQFQGEQAVCRCGLRYQKQGDIIQEAL